MTLQTEVGQESSEDEGQPGGATLADSSNLGRWRLAPNLILWLIIAIIGCFILWAYFTELDRTVRGQGRIVPTSQLQLVSNLEGGIVDAILVNVGAEVKKGDPLVRLDKIRPGAELNSNRAQFDSLNIKIARLRSEVDGKKLILPSGTSGLSGDQIEIERTLNSSRIAELASLTNAARARIRQSKSAAAEARANYSSRLFARDAAQSEAAIFKSLVERGIEPRLSLSQAESRAAIAASEVNVAAAAISRAEASISEAEAALVQLRQNWRARVADELAATQAQRAALRLSLPAMEDRVRRTVVRAPLAGRVHRILANTLGGTVQPGDPLVEIVPSHERLIVEAAIKPADIGQVRIDQEAQVNISAYQSTVYGSLRGRVVTISPDTTVDQRTGEASYSVRIVTYGDLLDSNGKAVRIGPGMTVDVSLLGEKQSILDYIMTPITRLSRSALRE
jgi:adhesin transport system membrane fusion protein